MKVLQTLHPLGWFLVPTALLWTLVILVPLVHHGTWYAGYPFFISERSFSDLLVFVPQFQRFHQSDFYTVSDFPLTYPAFACLLIAGLLAAGHGVAVFCAPLSHLRMLKSIFTGKGLVACNRTMPNTRLRLCMSPQAGDVFAFDVLLS